MSSPPSKDITWFLSKVNEFAHFEPNSGCWLWGGKIDKGGYGQIRVNKRVMSASRVSCHFFHGLDLDDRYQMACHKCQTRSCVNPAHIYLGNGSTNMKDAFKLGTKKSGFLHESAVIKSHSHLLEIGDLFRSGYSMRKIAKLFNTTHGTISNALKKRVDDHS